MKYFRDSFVYIRHQLAFPTWGNAKTLNKTIIFLQDD